jgi:hypothetical protein
MIESCFVDQFDLSGTILSSGNMLWYLNTKLCPGFRTATTIFTVSIYYSPTRGFRDESAPPFMATRELFESS